MHRLKTPITIALAALCAAMPGIASAAEKPCLTPAEFSSLAGYAMPAVIKGTKERCATKLAPSAFLNRDGDKLFTRYSARKDKDWPAAKAAFLKMSADSPNDMAKMFKGMPDKSLQGVLDAMLEGMVAQQIPLERCATIDDFVRVLSPLPPQNTAELIALLVGLGSKAEEPKVGSLRICKS
jgi:hypothetical protein